ncbi:MAG: hypothetical protein EPN39_03155 [Chitinophagaceae bacterium]|jgi:hypothetical protein|nr:MAG: hypothetical protein EPN39_03155 [Chitinophagaceae bacterium]
MKLKSFINKVVDKAEMDTYGFAYVKYRRLILDTMLVLCLLTSLIFSRKEISDLFLMISFMIALFRLEETIMNSIKQNRRHTKDLKGNSVIKEAKRIINKR